MGTLVPWASLCCDLCVLSVICKAVPILSEWPNVWNKYRYLWKLIALLILTLVLLCCFGCGAVCREEPYSSLRPQSLSAGYLGGYGGYWVAVCAWTCRFHCSFLVGVEDTACFYTLYYVLLSPISKASFCSLRLGSYSFWTIPRWWIMQLHLLFCVVSLGFSKGTIKISSLAEFPLEELRHWPC